MRAPTAAERAIYAHDAIARLEAQRESILRGGDIAPQGAWIESGEVRGRPGWFQAFWKAQTPMFDGKKRRYIGKVGSDKHARAVSAYGRRKEFERINRQISLLEELSCE